LVSYVGEGANAKLTDKKIKKKAPNAAMRSAKQLVAPKQIAEKGVQGTPCWGSGGIPQLQNSPKNGGYRGLMKTFSALY